MCNEEEEGEEEEVKTCKSLLKSICEEGILLSVLSDKTFQESTEIVSSGIKMCDGLVPFFISSEPTGRRAASGLFLT